MLTDLRDKALFHAELAVTHESEGALWDALKNYRNAASLLITLSDQVTRQPLKEHYLKLAERYIGRCYELRQKPTHSKSYSPSDESAAFTMPPTKIIDDIIISKIEEVGFDSIVGLTNAKKALFESIVTPIKHPEWFTGIRKPWRGILLYGPPGCGKTMLARATASSTNAKFLSIDPATIFSKWVGESEQNIKTVFNYALGNQPSIVFIDEIDSIAGHRGLNHEIGVEKRVKTQLMTYMDGLRRSEKDQMLILGATNVPWDLDQAYRRRFEKRIYVGLPNEDARITLFIQLMEGLHLPSDQLDYISLAKISEGYTCADIALICREAAMEPIREATNHANTVSTPPELRLVSQKDFEHAFQTISPSVTRQEILRHEAWRDQFTND